VTVPTPIDQYKRPDLRPLVSASETVGRDPASGHVVVYESTRLPRRHGRSLRTDSGAGIGLKFNQDFFVGYSPERINPGDKNTGSRPFAR